MRIKVFEIWVLFGLAALVVGDGLALASTWQERMRALESGGYEMLLGVALAGLTVLYWIREAGVRWDSDHGARHVTSAFAILCGYVVVMPHLGYLLSTLVAVTAFMRGFGRYRWWSTLAFAIVFAVGTAWFWAEVVIVLPHGILPWPAL